MEIAQEIKWTSIKSKCKLFNFQYMTDLTHIYQQLPLFDYKSAKKQLPTGGINCFFIHLMHDHRTYPHR